jgi:hypothetical protein
MCPSFGCHRRSLVGALKGGSAMTISFLTLQGVNFEQFFDVSTADEPPFRAPVALSVVSCGVSHPQERFFPRQVMERGEIFNQTVWEKLLRPEKGDPQPHEFLPRPEFAFMVLTKTDSIPPETARALMPIRVGETARQGQAEGEANDDDTVAEVFGAKEVRG